MTEYIDSPALAKFVTGATHHPRAIYAARGGGVMASAVIASAVGLRRSSRLPDKYGIYRTPVCRECGRDEWPCATARLLGTWPGTNLPASIPARGVRTRTSTPTTSTCAHREGEAMPHSASRIGWLVVDPAGRPYAWYSLALAKTEARAWRLLERRRKARAQMVAGGWTVRAGHAHGLVPGAADLVKATA
ncbi:hypothetical protein [Candidatus Mycobacterium methanotrophicum]|uniref:Uncharacterized protein n=1 Tax=Candidatus Mycobacterium methanotrophicum TaxID=2943498 RepID=A0ABY4QSA8_9MYCO|nr:hypothetical protein [Candidatus Mycobacterium methanotrophicum]UQX13564.1 hypothetical protein M5I08_25570 [Candidatus Mycobacterium methanotrophicum]